MFSTLSSSDYTVYTWPEDDLARFSAYIASLATWTPAATSNSAAALWHNRPPPSVSSSDPGPDRSYHISFPIPEWVSRDQVWEFERALQEQGPYPNRLAALDNAAWRVRASVDVNSRAFRLYHGILDTSKGKHRACLLDYEKLGHLTAIPDPSNLSKVLRELENPNLVVTLRYAEGRLGSAASRKVLIAPVVTAEDRARATIGRIYAEAEAAKAASLAKTAQGERDRYHRRKQAQSCGSGDHKISCGQDNRKSKSLVVKPPFSCGQGNHLVVPHDSSTEEGDADAPTLSLSKHANGKDEPPSPPRTPSAASVSSSRTPTADVGAQVINGASARRGRASAAQTAALTSQQEVAASPSCAYTSRQAIAANPDARAGFDVFVATAKRCGLPVPQKVDTWLASIAVSIKERGLDGWKAMLAKVEASRFLCGENDRGWCADIDWLTKPKNFEKVLSGKYDNRGRANDAQPQSGPARQPQLDDMSGNLERSRIFLAKVGVGPDKPWPAGIGPMSLYHPTALFELGILATRGSS
jgi:hypothetical protein